MKRKGVDRELTISFAPLEGVTDSIFRRVHAEMFGGVDKYFIPFVSPTQNECWTPRQLRQISPENNDLSKTVPQILANNSDHFLWAAKWFEDAGYSEVNLNVGCPSGTVTAKRKGSGMLLNMDSLRMFLDDIFSKATIKISVKTRIGFYSVEEAPMIASLYSEYPIDSLIVHPRVRQEQYSGYPHMHEFGLFGNMPFPVVYNGDILTAEDVKKIRRQSQFISGIMIGRGMVGNPGLAREVTGRAHILKEEMQSFYSKLEEEYCRIMVPQSSLPRLKEILRYMEWFVVSNGAIQRGIRRADSLEKLHSSAMEMLSQPLREIPNNPNIHAENDMRI